MKLGLEIEDVLLNGHRFSGDGRSTFCNSCNFSMVNSFGIAINYGGADGEISIPPLLANVSELIKLNHSTISISEDYEVQTVATTECRIFLNGLSESSHGMGDAGSLSLTSLRSVAIVNQILQHVKSKQDNHAC